MRTVSSWCLNTDWRQLEAITGLYDALSPMVTLILIARRSRQQLKIGRQHNISRAQIPHTSSDLVLTVCQVCIRIVAS